MGGHEQLDGTVRAAIELWLQAFHRQFGDELVAVYIDGSIASGAFNPESSDIDLIALTRSEVPAFAVEDLDAAPRDALRSSGSPWSDEVEVTIAPKAAVSDFDPQDPPACWVLERGPAESFKAWRPDRGWLVHLHSMRSHPFVLHGPPPGELIRPVSARTLREVAVWGAQRWLGGYLEQPERLAAPGTRAFAVLTCCRLLYTRETGTIASKPAAGAWALNNLDVARHAVIRDALGWRKADATTGPSREAAVRLMRYTRQALQVSRYDGASLFARPFRRGSFRHLSRD